MSADEPEPTGDGDERRGPDIARAALARARAATTAVTGGAAPAGRGGKKGRPARRRGVEQRSGAGPDDRDPRLLGATVREFVVDRDWERSVTAAGVVGRWEVVAGPEVAAHCRPESLQDGVLTLVAESTAWATQLRLLRRAILDRVAAEVGPGVVREVRVNGPLAPDWRHGPRRVRGRGPRDTYG